MVLHQLVRDGQTQTGAFFSRGGRGTETLKLTKKSGLLIRWDAGPSSQSLNVAFMPPCFSVIKIFELGAEYFMALLMRLSMT